MTEHQFIITLFLTGFILGAAAMGCLWGYVWAGRAKRFANRAETTHSKP